MTPDERRAEIIAATLPLLREHGAEVTTSQIARAAGIAEGTIFRAFQDKQELLLAALHSAMSADPEVARIGEISLDSPLEERLIGALAITSDYQERLWSLLRLFRETGWQADHRGAAESDQHPRRQVERIGIAIARLFGPEQERLRLEPCSAAHLLLGLAFASRVQEHTRGEGLVTPKQLVELFLHGALAGCRSEAPIHA